MTRLALGATPIGDAIPEFKTSECGTDLSFPRPPCKKWEPRFDNGTDVGDQGVNVVNAIPGDEAVVYNA